MVPPLRFRAGIGKVQTLSDGNIRLYLELDRELWKEAGALMKHYGYPAKIEINVEE